MEAVNHDTLIEDVVDTYQRHALVMREEGLNDVLAIGSKRPSRGVIH
jgi:hypothetical protein